MMIRNSSYNCTLCGAQGAYTVPKDSAIHGFICVCSDCAKKFYPKEYAEVDATLTFKPAGKNEIIGELKILDDFVIKNFDMLYGGAVKLHKAISADYYAGRRIQIRNTRLNEEGVKICSGWHCYKDHPSSLAEPQLKSTVDDVQALIDASAKPVLCSFRLIIKEEVNDRNAEILLRYERGVLL